MSSPTASWTRFLTWANSSLSPPSGRTVMVVARCGSGGPLAVGVGCPRRQLAARYLVITLNGTLGGVGTPPIFLANIPSPPGRPPSKSPLKNSPAREGELTRMRNTRATILFLGRSVSNRPQLVNRARPVQVDDSEADGTGPRRGKEGDGARGASPRLERQYLGTSRSSEYDAAR